MPCKWSCYYSFISEYYCNSTTSSKCYVRILNRSINLNLLVDYKYKAYWCRCAWGTVIFRHKSCLNLNLWRVYETTSWPRKSQLPRHIQMTYHSNLQCYYCAAKYVLETSASTSGRKPSIVTFYSDRPNIPLYHLGWPLLTILLVEKAVIIIHLK